MKHVKWEEQCAQPPVFYGILKPKVFLKDTNMQYWENTPFLRIKLNVWSYYATYFLFKGYIYILGQNKNLAIISN